MYWNCVHKIEPFQVQSVLNLRCLSLFLTGKKKSMHYFLTIPCSILLCKSEFLYRNLLLLCLIVDFHSHPMWWSNQFRKRVFCGKRWGQLWIAFRRYWIVSETLATSPSPVEEQWVFISRVCVVSVSCLCRAPAACTDTFVHPSLLLSPVFLFSLLDLL